MHVMDSNLLTQKLGLQNITQANTMLQLCEKYDFKCIMNLRAWAKKPTAKNAKKPWTFERPLPKTSNNHWGFVSAAATLICIIVMFCR